MTLRASFNEDIFSFLSIYLPEYEQQKRIGNLLYLTEKKIQLNKRINDNLEQQAKMLYDYWFTQFDFPNENGKPYRSSGGKMVWNEQLKREIPQDWSVIKIDNICKIISGFPFSSNEYTFKGKYKLLTIKNVQDDGINLNVDNYIDSLPETLPPYCKLEKKNLLMSLTGNVGRVGILYENNCLLNQRVALICPKEKGMDGFVYSLFKSSNMRKTLEHIATGTSQKNLSPLDTENIHIPYYYKVCSQYSSLINKTIELIVSHLAENEALSRYRDWLLPMLMNGQASISD